MAIKKTNEEFVKEVYSLVGNEYEFLEKYINSQTKIKCKHKICGHVWGIIPNSFLRGKRCPQCNGGVQKTNEKFIQEVYELVGDEYVFLEKYINDRTKIKCRHDKCGHVWEVVPSSFLQGRGCPQCKGKKISKTKTWTDKRFRQETDKLVGDEYIFLGEYINSSTKIKVRHNICGNEYDVTPNHFINGTRCPQCNRPNYNRDSEQFKQQIYELVGDEYTFLEDYISSAMKIKCKHNICGCEWDVQPNNFFNGTRCPQCAESKGEQIIREYLQSKNIEFQQEYSVDDLVGVGGGLLRFDFAIFDKKEKLIFLIEYDGEFHYRDVYEDGRLKLQQIHDNLKNQYCKDNNILLLRIPYWEFNNIEGILLEKLA